MSVYTTAIVSGDGVWRSRRGCTGCVKKRPPGQNANISEVVYYRRLEFGRIEGEEISHTSARFRLKVLIILEVVPNLVSEGRKLSFSELFSLNPPGLI